MRRLQSPGRRAADVLRDSERRAEFAHVEKYGRLILKRYDPRAGAAAPVLFMSCADELRHGKRFTEPSGIVVNAAKIIEHRGICKPIGLPRIFEQASRTPEDLFCGRGIPRSKRKLCVGSTTVDLQDH